MVNEVSPLMPESKETLELMEAYRKLFGAGGVTPLTEENPVSLAQPSPYRFVPSIVTNQSVPMPEGE